MAPLRQFMFLLVVVTLSGQSLAEPENLRLPANVFDKAPYSRQYQNWWRPFRTVFDVDKVSEIQRQIDGITTTEARGVILRDLFGNNATSSFLYPVLAANGAKGRIILKLLLSDYTSGAPLDDRWLLIIAALGRSPSAETQKILEGEFDRVLSEYTFSPVTPSNPVPTADARLPVADALLACMAGEQILTAKAIERLVQRIQGTPQNELLWMIGLDWARTLMPEEEVLNILEGGFGGCTDSDLLAAMNQDMKQSGRLSVLAKFCSGPGRIWPLMRAFLLRKTTRRQALKDYLLTLYAGILVSQADSRDGTYQLDERVVDTFCNSQISVNRSFALRCWVLSRCRASLQSPCWENLIAEHGENLREDDRSMAQSFLDRILDPHASEKTPELRNFYDENGRRPFSTIARPGVHIMGFRRAGGRVPERITAP